MTAVRRLLILTVMLGVAVTIATVAVVVPIGEGPDELGHVAYAGHLEVHGRPDPATTELVQAQHPPLYHAVVGKVYGLLREHSEHLLPAEGPTRRTLPFLHRRVDLPWAERIPDPIEAQVRVARQEDPGAPALKTIPTLMLYLLRATGLIFGLLTAWLVLRSATRNAPTGSATALLCAACLLMVPQFGAIFGAINNDQLAILGATLGFGLVLRAWRSGRVDAPGPLLVAGLVFALAALAKLLVLGGLAAAGGLLLSLPGTGGQRLKRLALLGAPLVLPAAWALLHVQETGSLHAVEAAARSFPELLRRTPPDFPFGYLEIVGLLLPSFLAEVGSDAIGAGKAWTSVALALPVLVLASALAAAFGRGAGPLQRALGRAFLLGLAVQLAAIFYGNRSFLHIHGRYLHVLMLPAVLALAAGAPLLFGRSRFLLKAMAVWMALGTVLLLHGRLLPSYHAGHGIQSLKGIVAYLDLGRPQGQVVPSTGQPGKEPDHWYPRPRDRFLMTMQPGGAVHADVRHDPADLLVLSAWLPPIGDSNTIAQVQVVDLLADGAPVSGLISPLLQPGWRSWPVPPSASRDGVTRLYARLHAGVVGGASEFLLRRLPLRLASARRVGNEVEVAFESRPDGTPCPPLEVQLQATRPRRTRLGAPWPLPGPDASGLRRRRIPIPAGHEGPLELLLLLPEAMWSDFKLAAYRVPEVEVTGTSRSPGRFVLQLPARAEDAGPRVIASFSAVFFPANTDHSARLLDGEGNDVSARFAVRLVTAEGEERAPIVTEPGLPLRFSLSAGLRPQDRLEILQLPGPAVEVDRLSATARPPFVLPIAP